MKSIVVNSLFFVLLALNTQCGTVTEGFSGSSTKNNTSNEMNSSEQNMGAEQSSNNKNETELAFSNVDEAKSITYESWHHNADIPSTPKFKKIVIEKSTTSNNWTFIEIDEHLNQTSIVHGISINPEEMQKLLAAITSIPKESRYEEVTCDLAFGEKLSIGSESASYLCAPKEAYETARMAALAILFELADKYKNVTDD